MKQRIFTAILLFISAYSPLFLILMVKDFDFSENQFKHPLTVCVLLVITILSILLLFTILAKIKRGSMAIRVRSVKDRSVDLINYTIPYILSFFGFDLSKPGDAISLTIFLLILLLFTIKSKAAFLNPLLVMAGYGLYDLNYEFDGKLSSFIVISKYDLRVGNHFYVRSLTRFLYLVTDEVKESQNVTQD